MSTLPRQHPSRHLPIVVPIDRPLQIFDDFAEPGEPGIALQSWPLNHPLQRAPGLDRDVAHLVFGSVEATHVPSQTIEQCIDA